MPVEISGSSIGDMAGGPVDIALNDLSDVVVTPLVSTGQYLRYNGITSTWGNSSLDADIFAYIDGSLIANDGIYITEVPGPNTFTIGLGNITPLSVTSSGTITGSNLTGTNTGDQTITLTGDVTGTGTGTFSTTLSTVNADVGTFGSASTIPVVTVNAKGLITGISSVVFSGTSPLATSLAGGTTGSLPYQIATDTTAFLSAATANHVLIGGASAPSWSTTPAIQGTNFTVIPNSALINNSTTIGTTTIALGASSTTLTGLTSVSSASFTGALTGNATTATTLATGRTIGMTGDVTWTSSSFDGSVNVTGTSTLATVNASPQTDTFRKITVNGKGLVTATSAVAEADITTALGYTPVNKAGDTMTGDLILNADPTQALGAATKQYVDNIAGGLNAHNACEAATSAASNLSANTYNNGTGGVGATLTATSNVVLGTVGGYAGLDVGDRLLVKDQVSALENGVYIVTSLGSAGTSPWVLTRSSDFDGSPTSEVMAGDFVYIQEGSLGGTQWVQTNVGTGVGSGYDYVVVGTDDMVFSQLSGSGTYTGGTGIAVTGTSISLATGNTLSLYNLATNGLVARTGLDTVTARNLVVSGTGLSVSNADGVAGNPTITSNATSANAVSTIVARDASGNFNAGVITASLSGNATSSTNASNVVIVDDTTTATSVYPTWANGTSGNQPLSVSNTNLSFVPSTGILSATGFSGSGASLTNIPNTALINSSTTIGTTTIALGASSTSLTGLTSVSSTSFTGALTGNASTATTLQTARTLTIGATGKLFDGSANVSWTLSELGATTVGSNLFTLTNPSAVRFIRINADNTVSALDAVSFRTAIGAETGTVTSVSGTGTVSGITLSGTVTTTGSLSLGGTLTVTPSNFSSQSANTFLAAPDGTAGTPTFRTIVASDIPTLNQNTTGNAATATALQTSRTINGVSFDGTSNITIPAATLNPVTFNNSGTGDVSGTDFDGSVARTISYNTIGASPLSGSSSLTTTGTITSGTWSGSFGSISGANLTNLTAGNLTGTIPSAVLGNSTLYVGTTAVPLNRPSANQSLTGISSITLPGATSGTIQLLPTAVAGTTVLTLPSTTGTVALTSDLPTVNNGTLTLSVSGTGLSGSASFTANQSGNSTFTVTSNATSANTASTIVARDASGNFSAGTITAALTGNATTATTLATGRTIGMTGDVTWTSASFDGSANVSGTSTLATVTQGAGSSFVKITLDTKGRVTGNTAVAAADITGLVDGTYVNVAGDTMSGKLTINKSTAVTVGTVGSSDQYEMINNGSGGVVMTFHRSGAYAINMGLDTDNVFRLGGYSNGLNTYRIQSDTAGNFTAQGNVNAASDERLKTDWADLPVDFVNQLAQVKHGSYTRLDTKERQVGVSAQSLRKLLPEAVAEDIDGILSVSYGNAAMVSVIKMAERLVDLEAKLEMLVDRIATLEGKV